MRVANTRKSKQEKQNEVDKGWQRRSGEEDGGSKSERVKGRGTTMQIYSKVEEMIVNDVDDGRQTFKLIDEELHGDAQWKGGAGRGGAKS